MPGTKKETIPKNNFLVSMNIQYIRQQFENGIHGTPYSRKKGAFIYYGGN